MLGSLLPATLVLVLAVLLAGAAPAMAGGLTVADAGRLGPIDVHDPQGPIAFLLSVVDGLLSLVR